MSAGTPPPASPGGPANPAGSGWLPSTSGRELPPPYVPLPAGGAGQIGLLNPTGTLRKMRSELQRRRTLVILMFIVVAVAIIDYGPEPPQVRLNQPAKATVEVKVPFPWTESSDERINTIFASKPLYYRLTPTNEWVAKALKDLYEAIDLYKAGMPAQAFEDAIRERDLLQPKFARCLFRYLEERHGLDPDRPGAESEMLKQYLEIHLLAKLAEKTDYFLANTTKEFESKRTKASEFKIIREPELELIARKSLTPDNYPARTVSKEGWVNNWRLHEDLDPELKRWLADGVSAGAIDDDLKESLYEYFTGYAFKRDADNSGDAAANRPRVRHLGPTLELLGFNNDPNLFPQAPDDPKDEPNFPDTEAAPSAVQPALPNWNEANYYLKKYVKQRLGREVMYTPPPALREPGTPLAEENVLVWGGTMVTPKVLDLLWEHARNVKAHASTLQNVQRISRHTLAAL
ncbi:MAG TPA: hypothetical protein VL860_08490, partial [Planctomycetota bacterium]|nr:hypothetical protein [Planctomycetota bacterium]